MRFLKFLGLLLLALVVLGVVATLRTPRHLHAFTGEFGACPSRPSCVSSLAVDAHRIEPLRYRGSADEAQRRLRAVIESMPGARIEHEAPRYLHAVFVTPTMRFHDDLELLLRPDGTIEVRSLSRFGYGDHGVNRARVERLRTLFDAAHGLGAPSNS